MRTRSARRRSPSVRRGAPGAAAVASASPAGSLAGRLAGVTPRLALAPAPRAAAVAARWAGLELVLWAGALAALVLRLGFTAMVNSDLWFHLAAGRLILERGAVPAVDTWSYTAAGQPWHNHEWLADVVFAAWADAGGVESLVYWQWALLLATFLLLFDTVRRLGAAPWLAAATVGLGAVVAAPFFDIRPHLYSLLFLVVVMRLVWLRPRLPAWTPLVFVLWANLHAGALFGCAVLAMLVAARRIAEHQAPTPVREARRGDALRVALSAAALCATPFGLDTVLYPFRLLAAASPSRTEIAEWTSPFTGVGLTSPLFPWALLGAAVAGGILLVRCRRSWDAVGLGSLALLGLTVAMALQSRRFIPLFAIAQAVVLAAALSPRRWLPGAIAPPARRQRPRLRLAVATGALVFFVARLAPYPVGAAAFGPTVRLGAMPVETLNFAEVNALRGDVFASFLWGGYVHWRTAGRLRVFLDPRSDTLFSPETQRAYYRVQRLEDGWQSVIEGSGADFVLWERRHGGEQRVVEPLVRSGRWRRIYDDAVSVLLARTDLPLPRLRPTAASAFGEWRRGRDALGRGELAAAERHLQAAIDADPQLVQACDDLVRATLARGDLALARRRVERCDAILPHAGRRRMFATLRPASG